MNDHDLERQLTGSRQTTAEILYRMPDHPGLVQTFLWQELDRWNDDPRLTFPVCGSFATGGTQTWMDRSCRCGSVLHR